MRIKFHEVDSRLKFFLLLREKINKNWTELSKIFSIDRSSLDRYRNGKILLPEVLFNRFLTFLNVSEKEEILNKILRVQDNHGQIKGGKKAYLMNIEKFKEGRKKGIALIIHQKEKIRGVRRTNVLNIPLSSDICECIGAFIGDGFFNVYKNKLYHIEFAGDSRYDPNYYKSRIIPILKKVFPKINPHILKVKNKNSIRVIFYSRDLFLYLKDFFGFSPGKKVYTVLIPKRILDKPEFMASTIRGLFDTDGGIFFDKRKSYCKPYPRIFFNTVSKGLFSQVSDFLSRNFKFYSSYRKENKSYGLEIYGYKNLKKWMTLVGFSNERHLRKIASVA